MENTFFVRSLGFQWELFQLEYQLCSTPCLPVTYFHILKKVAFLDNMIRNGHRKFATSFSLCFRYIDDPIMFSNKEFWEYVKDIYRRKLNVERTNQSDNLVSYLDLTFTIEKDGKLSTKLYDKRDDFDFHTVNFPFLSSNISLARCCSYYDDFRPRNKMLVERFVSHRYRYKRLRNSFKKFYGR